MTQHPLSALLPVSRANCITAVLGKHCVLPDHHNCHENVHPDAIFHHFPHWKSTSRMLGNHRNSRCIWNVEHHHCYFYVFARPLFLEQIDSGRQMLA